MGVSHITTKKEYVMLGDVLSDLTGSVTYLSVEKIILLSKLAKKMSGKEASRWEMETRAFLYKGDVWRDVDEKLRLAPQHGELIIDGLEIEVFDIVVRNHYANANFEELFCLLSDDLKMLCFSEEQLNQIDLKYRNTIMRDKCAMFFLLEVETKIIPISFIAQWGRYTIKGEDVLRDKVYNGGGGGRLVVPKIK
jgi:hypothetical protein